MHRLQPNLQNQRHHAVGGTFILQPYDGEARSASNPVGLPLVGMLVSLISAWPRRARKSSMRPEGTSTCNTSPGPASSGTTTSMGITERPPGIATAKRSPGRARDGTSTSVVQRRCGREGGMPEDRCASERARRKLPSLQSAHTAQQRDFLTVTFFLQVYTLYIARRCEMPGKQTSHRRSRRLFVALLTEPMLALLLACVSAPTSPAAFIKAMQLGINLGNVLDAPFEGAWAEPAKEYYFDDYLNQGFKSVRVPVRWDKHTSTAPPWKVDSKFMDRVEQIVGWSLKRGLRTVLNSHHDDWLDDARE